MKIGSEIAHGLPEPKEGCSYSIETVEQVVTEKREYPALRVSFKDIVTGDGAATMLWLSNTVSEDSKLGSFLTALGNDTDAWLGKEVTLVRWREKERIVTAKGQAKLVKK